MISPDLLLTGVVSMFAGAYITYIVMLDWDEHAPPRAETVSPGETNEVMSPWDHPDGNGRGETSHDRISGWRKVTRGTLRLCGCVLRGFNVGYHIKRCNGLSKMNRIFEEQNEVLWRQQQDAQMTEQILRDEISHITGPNLQRAVNETLDRMAREALSRQQ